MLRIAIAVVGMVALVSNGYAQPMELPQRYKGLSDTVTLRLNMEGSSYFYNYEYFKDYALGYTQPGFSLVPTVSANFGKKLLIGGGVHLKKYWGDTPFGSFSPVLFARYEAFNNFYVQVGTLQNRDGHLLSSLLYNPLYKMDFRQENGLQLRYFGKRIFADAWVSWEHYLRRGADDQEHLAAGFSLLAKLTAEENPLEISLPVQCTFQHFGGQINDKSDTTKEMRTLANLSVGLQAAYRFTPNRKLGLFTQLVKVGDNSDFKPVGAVGGNMASWTVLFFKSKTLDLQLGYLYADRFYSNFGDPIFNTMTLNYSTWVKWRSQISATGSYVTEPYRGINFRFDAGGYLDTSQSEIDYYYGVGIVFDINVLTSKMGR